jgi:N-acetylglucosaminyldiphosphoundecaprenol N-acetyl-beta-D-mannosaminyltransferase
MKKLRVLGAHCLCVENVQQIKNYISELIEQKKGGYSVAINAEKIMMYSRKPEMKTIIDNSILPTPDGAGAVLAMKWLHGKKCIKLNLPRTIYELSNEKGYSVFVLGAKEEINEKAVNVLKERYPGMVIAGRRNGYFDSDDEVSGLITESKAQIVFAALGSPKQEIFSARFLKKHPDILFIGCGGTLDALAGKVKSAPDFFRYNNLEWLYRLYQSPKRIKRQWKLPFFLLRLIFAALFKRIRS